MLPRTPALLLLASAAAADNSVCYTDCCTPTCIETNRKFNFPPTTSADHSFQFTTSGVMSKDVTKATFDIGMTYMGTKINVNPATGSACGGPVTIKIEGGSLGQFTIDFSNGGKVTCPMKAGTAIGTSGTSNSNSDPPMGKFLTTTKANDQDGNLISCQITQVGGCGSNPPPPPAPAPGGKTYGCVNNVCTEAPTGVPLATCQVVCHKAALAGPPPSDPYDAGCAAKTDCESCIDTQVPGPVPLPGLQQNCGWCFATGSCHDSKILESLKCELKCTAKRLPVFDGPVCPSSTCNPKKYTCAAGTCHVTGDQHSGNGTSIELCEAECAIAPPPAPVMYQCAGGQCVESPAGIDLDTCQALCSPQPPAPPAPAGTLYQCASGKCSEAATGIALETCQQLCHPPAPTPAAPATQYQCASGQCTESPTGITLETCQQLCH